MLLHTLHLHFFYIACGTLWSPSILTKLISTVALSSILQTIVAIHAAMVGTQPWRRSFEWKLIGIQSTQVSTLNMISEAANVATWICRHGGKGVVILIVEEGNTSDSL